MTRSLLHGGLLAALATVAVGCSSGPAPHTVDLRALTSAKTSEAVPAIDMPAPRPQKLEQLPEGAVALRPNMVGVRAGALFPTDSDLAVLDRPTFEFGILWRHRMGDPDGHWSFETGAEWWRMTGQLNSGEDAEVNKLTLPFTIGWNTQSTADWSRNKVNFFFGGGLHLASVYRRIQPPGEGPTHSTDPGYGLQLQAAVDFPMSDHGYASILGRYDWSRLFDHDVEGGIDDFGGFMLAAEIGFRF